MSERIVIEQLIDAPPSVVFTYLTESGKWARWQGVDAMVEPVPGGVLAVSMPIGAKARGAFVEVLPNERVVFTWGWVDHPLVPPGSTTVEIDLIAEGSATRVRLTHTGLPPEEISIHTEGWNHYLPRLAAVCAGIDPGPDGIPS